MQARGLGPSATALGDPILIAMIVGLRRHLTTGNCLCNAMSGSRLESPSECRYGSVYAARRQYVGSIDAGYTTRRRDATVQI